MKFIATTQDKLDSIAVQSGQLIFSRDNRVIYLDTDVRTSFEQIMTVANETVRQGLTSPVQGFYFVQETKTLWHYEAQTWTRITEPPKESLVFAAYEEFPIIGEEKVLYCDKDKIYQWDNESQSYIEMGSLSCELIS